MELIKSQGLYFLASIIWGLIILFLYDWLRIFRKLIPHSIFFFAIEDLIFWLIGSLFVFQMIFERNNGILRLFFIFAFLAGMYTYYLLVRDHFVNITVKFITLLFSPIAYFIKKIRKILKIIQKFLKNILKKVKTSVIMALHRLLQR